MRNGRDPNPDHDQKSPSLPPKQHRQTPKQPQQRPITVTRKTCSTCRNEYAPGAFARDYRDPSGLQPQCRSCRREWEADGILVRARGLVMRECPDAWNRCDGGVDGELLRLWSETNGKCHWCGCRLTEWQASGHCLDRINSHVPHIPENVKLACWPCNSQKGSMNPEAWAPIIEGRVRRYGAGKVPHDAVDAKRYRRIERLDLSEFLICADQQLPLFGGAP